VLSGINGSLIVPEPSASPSPPRSPDSALPAVAWSFDSDAASAGSTDSITLAAADSASDACDGLALDKPEPPAAPGEGRVRMALHAASPRVGRACPSPPAFASLSTPSDLTTETRSTSSEPTDYHFTLTGGIEGRPVALTWPSLSCLPKDRLAILTDLDTGKRTFMRSRAQYEFPAPGDAATRSFTVTVKPASQGALLISGLTAPPTRGRAYDIGLTLSADANVAGRAVADIANGRQTPSGRSSLTWNARRLTGTHVPPGTYLLRLTARTESGEQGSAVTTLHVAR
jgi:hypothetical protein